MGVPCAASCCHKPGTPMSVVHESTRGRLLQARECVDGTTCGGKRGTCDSTKACSYMCVSIYVYRHRLYYVLQEGAWGRARQTKAMFRLFFYFISLSQSIYAFLLSSFARPDVALLKPQRQTRQKCQASPCLDDAPRALQQARHHQLATKDLQSSALVLRASQPAVHAA